MAGQVLVVPHAFSELSSVVDCDSFHAASCLRVRGPAADVRWWTRAVSAEVVET